MQNGNNGEIDTKKKKISRKLIKKAWSTVIKQAQPLVVKATVKLVRVKVTALQDLQTRQISLSSREEKVKILWLILALKERTKYLIPKARVPLLILKTQFSFRGLKESDR
jgi:hypothetical protein